MSLFGGSESDSASASGTAAAQTQLGNPVSVNTSSGKKSYVYVTLHETDQGTVEKSFNLADKVVDSHKDILKAANNFAVDTVAAAQEVSGQIIEAGKYSAGATERIAGAFEAFVDEQNNPDNKNTALLIVGAVGVLVLLITVKK